MSENIPTFDEFKNNIEELFGQQLTGPASVAAEDFYNNWSSFGALIENRSLSAQVDALRLGLNFPQYKRYHSWKGAGKLLFILGLVIVWFYWSIGVVLLAIGVGLHLWGGRIQHNDAKNFAEELMKEATLSPATGGFAKLCSHYIAGTIQLASPSGIAHWPQYPSNVITGEQSFIQT
ncbi:MAG: hypothetical protein ACLFV1_04735 [Thiohalophilus sp.]